MQESWHQRVAIFVDQLEQIAETIASILEQTTLETTGASAAEVEKSMTPLLEALNQLEEKIAQREALLTAKDAPAAGLGLTEKLQGTKDPDDAGLAARCKRVGDLIHDANQQAISLFVCQFHLSEFSAEILRLISGADLPSTYETTQRTAPTASPGGLFNESV